MQEGKKKQTMVPYRHSRCVDVIAALAVVVDLELFPVHLNSCFPKAVLTKHLEFALRIKHVRPILRGKHY